MNYREVCMAPEGWGGLGWGFDHASYYKLLDTHPFRLQLVINEALSNFNRQPGENQQKRRHDRFIFFVLSHKLFKIHHDFCNSQDARIGRKKKKKTQTSLCVQPVPATLFTNFFLVDMVLMYEKHCSATFLKLMCIFCMIISICPLPCWKKKNWLVFYRETSFVYMQSLSCP